MIFQETEKTELKRVLNDSFVKEVVAFLNSMDGTIYMGVEDDGTPVGVNKLDETLRNIADIITTQILPNPQEYIKIGTVYENGTQIIEVSVKKGNGLYYIKKYGRSATGCFIRIGTSARSMTEEQIEKQFIEGLNIPKLSIKDMESYRQDLTFEQFKYLLNFRDVHINDSTFEINFNLRTKSGLYNTLAFLLSDQNDVSIKVVRFKGTNKSDFISRKEFGNCCLIKAMANSLEYVLDILNIVQTEIVNGVRVDTPYFDEDSFREAWINAICHHDWTQGTPPAVYAFDDRIEIISHGLLKQDLTIDEFYNGVSKPVNEELAKILTQMHYIEQSGRGIPTIIKKYGKDVFRFGTSFIECIIPYNIVNEEKIKTMNGNNSEDKINVPVNVPVNIPVNVPVNKTKYKILDLLKQNNNLTYDDLVGLLNVSRKTIMRNISDLKEQNKIKRIGSDKSGYWEIIE